MIRCPGDISQKLATCSIWANDFASTGIQAPCDASPIVTFNAAPELGAAWGSSSVAGVTIKCVLSARWWWLAAGLL